MSFSRRLIAGTGPVPSRVMLVGEAGGWEEHQQGRPFVGKAGMVVSVYGKAAGLDRTKVYIDNIYPYWTGPGNPDPTPSEIREGALLMRATLRRVKPKFVGALGRIPSRWFLGKGFELKRDHGLGFEVRMEGLDFIVVPCYHPAAGFYDASAAAICQKDLITLAEIARGERGVWEERPLPKSKLVPHPTTRSWDVTPQDGDAMDTEGSVWLPQMMSWSAPHGNYVSKFNARADAAPKIPRKLTFHYGLHDLKVLRRMGVDTDKIDWDDTIAMAFVIAGGGQDNSGEGRAGNLGLSLKVLAYRELGVRMTDFEDLVRPYYNKRVEDWVNDLLDKELPEKSEPELVEEKGEWKIYTPNPPRRRFGAVLLDAITGEKEPEKRWGDLPAGMRELGEKLMGERFPSISTSIVLVPEDDAVQYAGTDAWATRELEGRLRGRLKERGLEQAYEIDRKALPFVDMIQRNGLPVDKGMVEELWEELEADAKKSAKRMKGIVGRKNFNPGSRDDVADFLFRVHRLEAPRETKGGQDSTDEKTVKILRARVEGAGEAEELVEFLDELLEYRECQKYLGTYVEYVLGEMRETGDGGWRLYPDDLSTTRVVSGRLSGRLLTFPTRTERGAKIRKCFVAGEGKKILSVDLSQIELRMMAEMSQDKVMLGAFRRGEDLHSLTARVLFKIPKGTEVPKAKRYVAKTLNFAILYGISAKALLEQLIVAGIYDFKLADCERFIREWFELYHGVREYLDKLYVEAEKIGEVRDWAGRVRYVPNIRLPKGPLKEKAQRDVGNFPIQAGARELVKIAEGEMVPWLRGEGMRDLVLAILDVHDETLFEVDEDVVEETGEIVRGMMLREGRERFGVPLEAGVSWGGSWGEAK